MSSELSSSLEEEDDNEDVIEEDDDEAMELFLEIFDESIWDDEDEDAECNIWSTTADCPSKRRRIDVLSCCRSSDVLHRRRDIRTMVATRFRRSRTLEILFMGTPENSFVRKN